LFRCFWGTWKPARCLANLEDLREEDRRDAAEHERLRERCFASSVGFLSRSEP